MADLPTALDATLESELEGLARELAEIDLLVGQARTEAGRHEQKRAQAAERLAGLAAGAPPAELAEANAQVLTLTRRAAVMEAQLDVLAGKQKILERYRDGLTRVRKAVGATEALAGTSGGALIVPPDPAATGITPAVRRVILAAQEDLRRDIARAMHDGPAQSLTNIVLQAQIVERLLDHDPAAARAEVRELMAMVQRTLEATKAFIFDVRPMVLDDLGPVPTLRRVARDRSRRAGVPVEFESLGSDRRLPMELESAIFRVADEAVACLVGGHPEKVVLTLDWGDELEVAVRAIHPASSEAPEEEPPADMPAALREMVDDRRARVAAHGSVAVLTAAIRREIDERAAAAGGRVEFAGDGRGVTARFPLPTAPADA
ncbi:MAG TPA: histidine kinase [Candidatus Nanopelagicales bacterium]|nr:histidine kinase [Candidatus Nanopelagicales bacterium]